MRVFWVTAIFLFVGGAPLSTLHAQTATFEDLFADAQKVKDLGDIARPFIEKCNNQDPGQRRECEGMRHYLSQHLRGVRFAANVDDALEMGRYEPKTKTLPL